MIKKRWWHSPSNLSKDNVLPAIEDKEIIPLKFFLILVGIVEMKKKVKPSLAYVSWQRKVHV